jgi:hypothetical protein
MQTLQLQEEYLNQEEPTDSCYQKPVASQECDRKK